MDMWFRHLWMTRCVCKCARPSTISLVTKAIWKTVMTQVRKIVVGSKNFGMMNVIVFHLLFSEPLLQVNYDRVQCPSVAILDEHLHRKNASGWLKEKYLVLYIADWNSSIDLQLYWPKVSWGLLLTHQNIAEDKQAWSKCKTRTHFSVLKWNIAKMMITKASLLCVCRRRRILCACSG